MIATSITRPLPSAVADRLVKIACLLASNQTGEVVAEVREATRLLREHDCIWGELLALIVTPQPPTRSQHRPAPRQGAADWRSDVAASLAYGRMLTDWELEFVISLQSFRRLTPKQAAILDRLADRICAP